MAGMRSDAVAMQAAKAAASLPSSGTYFDVHTHVGTTWNGDKALCADDLVRWMDEHNVARAVVLPLVSPESSSFLNLTEQALDAASRFPDRLVPFCCVDPRTSYRGGRAGLRAMLKQHVDRGAKGFGEHKAGLPIGDPKMRALYEVCDDLRLPVLFHMDEQRGMDEPGLPGLESVLKAFPKVPFIGHGSGFWASISGEVTARDFAGYPGGPVKPGGALDRLFQRYPNLWGDLFGREFLLRNADRLLFGSDYLKPGQYVPQFELLANFDLPAEARAKIERGNACRLLGIKV
jgi:predicted TIM-barrel fold metal-dependent hydrolase